MSKFKCHCGYIIGFNEEPLRYAADFIPGFASDALHEALGKALTEFISAADAGQRDLWMRKFYRGPMVLDYDSVISDILSDNFPAHTRQMFQCEQCGRLWIQGIGEGGFSSYRPEGDWRGALETPMYGFVRYIEGQNFFGSHISSMRHENNVVRLVLQKDDETICEVAFTGVTNVKTDDAIRRGRIRFLSEWTCMAPQRKFIFDTTEQSSKSLLEISALDVQMAAWTTGAKAASPGAF